MVQKIVAASPSSSDGGSKVAVYVAVAGVYKLYIYGMYKYIYFIFVL